MARHQQGVTWRAPGLALVLALAVLMAGCSGVYHENYLKQSPPFDFATYFNGPIKAWGLVQNRSGQVVQQFDVVMLGTWQGPKGELVEDFSYYDGRTQRRIWYLERQPDGRYTGRADDILGVAQGRVLGNAGHFTYSMDLPVGDTQYRLAFDDWMWQMRDGVLINRSYLKKWGIRVAEVTIFMQRQPPGPEASAPSPAQPPASSAAKAP